LLELSSEPLESAKRASHRWACREEDSRSAVGRCAVEWSFCRITHVCDCWKVYRAWGSQIWDFFQAGIEGLCALLDGSWGAGARRCEEPVSLAEDRAPDRLSQWQSQANPHQCWSLRASPSQSSAGAGDATDLASEYAVKVCVAPKEAEGIPCPPSALSGQSLSRRALWQGQDFAPQHGSGSRPWFGFVLGVGAATPAWGADECGESCTGSSAGRAADVRGRS